MIRLILLRVLETFFRRPWAYIWPALLAVAAGVLFFLLVPAEYQVRGTIYVQRESLLTALASDRQVRQFTTPANETMSEIFSLLNTNTFAITVLENTNLREQLTLSPRERDQVIKDYRTAMMIHSEGTNIVVVTATDKDALLAQQMAVATMDAYVQWRVNFERADSQIAQQFFVELIERYEDQLSEAERELRNYLLIYPDPVRGSRSSEEVFEIDRLQRAVNESFARVALARGKEEDARLALAKVDSESTQEYLIIDAPSIPNAPPSVLRRAITLIVGAAAVGIVLSLVRLLLAIILDRSFYFPLDVQYGLKHTTLATLPYGLNPGGREASKSQDENAQASAVQISPVKSS